MANQHKNPMIGFNPDDGTLQPWVKAEAKRRSALEGRVVTEKAIYEEALVQYREREQAKTRLSEEDDNDD